MESFFLEIVRVLAVVFIEGELLPLLSYWHVEDVVITHALQNRRLNANNQLT